MAVNDFSEIRHGRKCISHWDILSLIFLYPNSHLIFCGAETLNYDYTLPENFITKFIRK